MDVIDCGMRNVGGSSHICAALQMLLHVPEVSEFILNDREHRKGCRSLLCCSCALFKQLLDILSKQCTLPSFFIELWKKMCNNVPREKHRNAYEFLFRLITTIRLEHFKRMKVGQQKTNMAIWETMSSILFGGKQIVLAQCNECNPSEVHQEFLSVKIELQDQNLASQIESKLWESKAEFCKECSEVTSHWQPISVKMPQYLIVYATNCRLSGCQVQSVTVCGEDYNLKSCITQTATSPQALFTSISVDGVNKQFEDTQVKRVSRAAFARNGIPHNSTMTFLFVKKSTSTMLPLSIYDHPNVTNSSNTEEDLDTAEVSNTLLEERQVTVPSTTNDPRVLMRKISSRKNIGTQTEQKVESCDVGTQTNLIDYDRLKGQPCNFKSWTGLCVEDFEALYNLLGGDEVVMKLKQKYRQTSPSKKNISNSSRISGQNRLLLFLLRFRQGLTLKQLSFLFSLSESYLGDLFYVMTCHLCETFRAMSGHMFATAAQQLKIKPIVMKPFKNLRVILDGVSFSLETPTNFEQQGNTWSTYKHKNVALFIVGISCHGATIFCSERMEGSMSDKVATLKSNLKELLDEGDCIMVDKGFELQPEMEEIGCKVLRPPCKKRDRFFTKEEESLTKAIAAARIYVEHAMADIKDNRIFKGDIPLTLVPIISKLVYIAAFMRNFSPSRICNVSFRSDVTDVPGKNVEVDDPDI